MWRILFSRFAVVAQEVKGNLPPPPIHTLPPHIPQKSGATTADLKWLGVKVVFTMIHAVVSIILLFRDVKDKTVIKFVKLNVLKLTQQQGSVHVC